MFDGVHISALSVLQELIGLDASVAAFDLAEEAFPFLILRASQWKSAVCSCSYQSLIPIPDTSSHHPVEPGSRAVLIAAAKR